MSPAEKEIRATEVALSSEFKATIDDGRERIAAVVAPACPTAAFLVALRDEVERAVENPESVPYPELADADAYWEATVKPQSRATRDAVEAIVVWLEKRMIATVEVAEADLKALVDAAAGHPDAPRAEMADEVERRCLELHHQMAEVLTVAPSFAALDDARRSADDAMRVRATADVDSLKSAYLREAGGDEAHQRFAAQQWSETFSDRVKHRHSMLAAQPPWRHQEYALVGHERARDEVQRLIEEASARLQAPLSGLRGLLVERYDSAIGAQA